MQYDLDTSSPHAALFLHLRAIILAFHQVTEKKNAKQTSYYDDKSAVCFLRVRQDKVRLSFANGAKMAARFSALKGSAKIVRYVEFKTIAEVDSEQIKQMIEESLLLNIEKAAIRTLRSATALHNQQGRPVGDE